MRSSWDDNWREVILRIRNAVTVAVHVDQPVRRQCLYAQFEPKYIQTTSYLKAEIRVTVRITFQRDQASLDSFRREYEVGVRAQAERCEAAALTTVAAAATR